MSQLRGDLDWIVMRALEREKDDRYRSPAALAADLQRYLDDRPVEAGPPTLSYRLKKFTRRHRTAVAAALGGLALLMAALITTTMLW
ncbi:MAG: serine/threonine protein kinase, partial [Gammaproteobacteria bacterium]|nr:serine/threonine protein kinase [Gammaproteobacteria bacterium]